MKRPMLLGLSALATVLLAGTALAQPSIDDLEVTMTVADPDAQSDSNDMDLTEEDSVNDVEDGQADDVDNDGSDEANEADDADDGNVDDNQDGQDEDVDDGETDDGGADDDGDGDLPPPDGGGI